MREALVKFSKAWNYCKTWKKVVLMLDVSSLIDLIDRKKA
jgi:hypothetical protein